MHFSDLKCMKHYTHFFANTLSVHQFDDLVFLSEYKAIKTRCCSQRKQNETVLALGAYVTFRSNMTARYGLPFDLQL